MNDNRIRVRMAPEMMPVRMEDRLDLNAEIDVKVDSHLTGIGLAGVVVLALGVLAILVGSIMFIVAYPGDIYNNPDGWEASRAVIERILLVWGAGLIGLLYGSTMFFFGRTVLGSGQLDRFHLRDDVEGEA